MTIEITPTKNELLQAGFIGVHRRVMGRGKKTDQYANKSSWTTDVDGAIAELVVARHFGTYWSAGGPGAPDILVNQQRIEVRSTEHVEGHLIIQADNDPEAIYVLVVPLPEFVYSIRGAIRGRKGMIDTFLRAGSANGKDAWWVPQSALKPMEK